MIRLLKRFKNSLDLFKRVCTGRFWIPVGKIPKSGMPLFVAGDPFAIPRTDPHWRGQWKWVVCEFSPNLLPPSYVYFSTYAFSTYRYSRAISTRYVAFRIGCEDVTFFALKKSCGVYEENTLTQISRVLERESLEQFLLSVNVQPDDVTWV